MSTTEVTTPKGPASTRFVPERTRTRGGKKQVRCAKCGTWKDATPENFYSFKGESESGLHVNSACKACGKKYRGLLRDDTKAGKHEVKARKAKDEAAAEAAKAQPAKRTRSRSKKAEAEEVKS